MRRPILVAGIGNIFLGDDGFGVEVVRRLAGRPQPNDVHIRDFGIRGMDLAYALLDPYEALILVDIAARGEPPGTLYLIEPRLEAVLPATLDTHGMDPVKVLALARSLGAEPIPTYLVACEPAALLDGEESIDVLVQLSEPVRSAVEAAAAMVEGLLARIRGASTTGTGDAKRHRGSTEKEERYGGIVIGGA